MRKRVRVRLRLRGPHFVASEGDYDRGVPEQALVIKSEVFDNAVALAKIAGWKDPSRKMACRYLAPSQVPVFVAHVQKALATPPSAPSRSSPSRFSTAPDLVSFFAQPANARALRRVLDLLSNKGQLDVEEV